MDKVKESCKNCGHFLQYYAFLSGIYFRPVRCGKCKLKRVHKGFVEDKEFTCNKWVSNEEVIKKEREIVETGVQYIAKQLYDFLLKLSIEEKRVGTQILDNDFRKE